MTTSPRIIQEQQRQLLEAIDETLGPAAYYAHMAREYIELGDLAGLDYSTRCFAANARSAIASVNDLRALRSSKVEDA